MLANLLRSFCKVRFDLPMPSDSVLDCAKRSSTVHVLADWWMRVMSSCWRTLSVDDVVMCGVCVPKLKACSMWAAVRVPPCA